MAINSVIQYLSMRPYILCLLLVITMAAGNFCSAQQCLGYDEEVASYAVQYAACSNLLTHYQQDLTDWTYAPCLKAQARDKVTDLKVLVDPDLYLLAFFAYDA
jgi:hypothetical protein